jgi:hypothetical protein
MTLDAHAYDSARHEKEFVSVRVIASWHTLLVCVHNYAIIGCDVRTAPLAHVRVLV